MQNQEKIEEKKSSNLEEEKGTTDRIFNSGSDTDQKDTTWKGLADRYKRTWKGRIRDEKTRRGIFNFSFIVLASAVLGGAFSLPSAGATIATTPVSMVLGMAGGSIAVGYSNGLDDFVNAHLGAAVGITISLYLTATSIITGGSPLIVIGSLLAGVWYTSSLTVAAVGYGLMGRWMSPDEEE